MLKGKDRRAEPTEHDIYKFAPIFPKGTTSGTYLRYYQHRERVLTVEAQTDTTPPRTMMGRRPMGTRMKMEANDLRVIGLQNQRLLARIAQRMLEPSQIDNHNTWERPSDRAVYWRDEMLKTTYRNLYLLKRISEASSTYRRDKFLNDWVKQQRVMSMMSQYCHDWRKPEFTAVGLCPNFRRRARTAPPMPTGDCGCPEGTATKKRARKATTDCRKKKADPACDSVSDSN